MVLFGPLIAIATTRNIWTCAVSLFHSFSAHQNESQSPARCHMPRSTSSLEKTTINNGWGPSCRGRTPASTTLPRQIRRSRQSFPTSKPQIDQGNLKSPSRLVLPGGQKQRLWTKDQRVRPQVGASPLLLAVGDLVVLAQT